MKATVLMSVKHTEKLLYYIERGIACITIFAGHKVEIKNTVSIISLFSIQH
jgi:hypothetical protein